MAQTDQTSLAEVAMENARRSRGRTAGGVSALPTLALRAVADNPVLVKEFRTRMRGTRAYWVMLGYTLLLGGVLAMMYFAHAANYAQQGLDFSGTAGEAVRELGRQIYTFAFVAQAIMVALITPAITAGAITIEREQRSYELLVTTPLRSGDIIRGKLTAAVAFVVLLLTVSLPLVSLSFLVGGISPGEIFFSYLMLACAAFVYGGLGLFWSATLRTTAVATVVSYVTVLGLFVVTMIPGAAAGSNGGMPMSEVPFQSLNPVSATFNAVRPEFFFNGQVPSWIPGVILNLLAGLVIFRCAMARLEHFEPPHPLLLRLYSTLLWCAGALFFFGPLFGGLAKSWSGAYPLQQNLSMCLIIVLVFCALVLPIFTTGDVVIKRGESALGRYLTGFLPTRMLAADLSSGFPLMMLWAVVALAILPLGIVLLGKTGFFRPERVFVPGAVLILAVLFGLAGIGNALSVTLPSRWAACVMTYLAGVVLLVLPYFTLLPWYGLLVRPTTPQPLWQLLYLVPFMGISQLSDPAGFWSTNPPLVFGKGVPLWVVTSGIYLILGAACFALAAARIRREGARLQGEPEGAPVPQTA